MTVDQQASFEDKILGLRRVEIVISDGVSESWCLGIYCFPLAPTGVAFQVGACSMECPSGDQMPTPLSSAFI